MLRSWAFFTGMVVTLISVLSLGSMRCAGDGGTTPSPAAPGTGGELEPAPTGPTREETLLEQIDGSAVVRLHPDGWESLTPRQRILAWHLSRAALAGRDIYWDQIHTDGLAVRALMEGLYRHRDRFAAGFSTELITYTKKLWLNSGFYEDRTREKFVPGFTPLDLATAVALVLDTGGDPAELGIPADRRAEEHLDRLSRTIFEPTYQPLLTDKAPAGDGDILSDSAVNYYGDVTLAEVEAWAAAGEESFPLNSRVVKASGRLTEEVWRAGTGDGTTPPGLYATSIQRIIGHLEAAVPYAPAEQADALRRLIRFYRTGSPADWQAFDIAWLSYREPVVDTINGFIEIYKDPRSRKGAYEGLVHLVDPEKSRLMAELAAHALHFEERAPWDAAFKRQAFDLPVATVVNVITAVGDAGPGCALGVNLPNEEWIRERYGSKSVTLGNVLRAYETVGSHAAVEEFALPAEREAALEHAGTVNFLQTSMHEVLGHAAGAVSPDLAGTPADHLREHYNALEEARAELVALHHFWDPKLRELAGLESDGVPEAAYRAYARSGLLMLRRLKTGNVLQDDHMRATALIVEYLRDSGSIERLTEEGKTYYRVASLDQMRHGVAVLLSELQRIKATGDAQAAARLMETYAVEIDTSLRDEVVARATAAGLPDDYAVVFPRLEPVLDDDGNVIDVNAFADEDLAGQMLRLSAFTREEGS
jgi:dipeptidyl-peptidase-3